MLRREKVILKPESPLLYSGCGGTLTLTDDKLVWERSRWGVVQYYLSKGIRGSRDDEPAEHMEVDLSRAECGIGGRKVAWMIFLVPLLALIDVLSGGMRKTLRVYAPFEMPSGKYYFAVKDASSWLDDIEKVRGALGRG